MWKICVYLPNLYYSHYDYSVSEKTENFENKYKLEKVRFIQTTLDMNNIIDSIVGIPTLQYITLEDESLTRPPRKKSWHVCAQDYDPTLVFSPFHLYKYTILMMKFWLTWLRPEGPEPCIWKVYLISPVMDYLFLITHLSKFIITNGCISVR
ncbi:hypothetical protein BDA99DRAFT_541366 [Phascolomyces articulosus]|uniref:Uncharacterized protein n=1 Tax=Phascolomyces articulosus TaxID=60185 RepID=A0AAD5P9M6_9FUNG|nr:hypothetical protein BDA99DRAFT_541366 [Phascolomyces articulosus]